jgi:hypothetical protein
MRWLVWIGVGGVLVVSLQPVWSGAAQVHVAPGFQAEIVATAIARPIELAFDGAGRLVVVSHGWRGDAAAEIYRLDVGRPHPVDASRLPRLVIPFAEGPRKTAFGSLAVDPRSGHLVLGEENGNRVYRLTADARLSPLAVGLHHLVGGSSLAFDGQGRLVVLDFVSSDTRLRTETPLPPDLDWFTGEGYHGPLVFRFDSAEAIPLPRRLDVLAPEFPRGGAARSTGESLPRFISVAAFPGGDLALLSSLGEVFRLTADARLHLLARLPPGHYHRTHMAVAPDGSILVSTGFHIRQLLRISPVGAVSIIAQDLGDPQGIAVAATGAIYLAETALHRIVRIGPAANGARPE